MRAAYIKYVFPQALAERVLAFCDKPGAQQACQELGVLIGRDPIGWRPWLSADAAEGHTPQSGLVTPEESALDAENPGFLRQPQGQVPAYEAAVSPALHKARQALYDSTRLLMRAAPNEPLTQELFEAASQAWLAQVTAEPELTQYTAGYESLADTRLIWEHKQTQGRINLMGTAQLPPFFDGNTQLVELFVRKPHAACDLRALSHLPNLKCLTLYTDPKAPWVATLEAMLPHLTVKKVEQDKVVHLTVPHYPLPQLY